MTAAPLNLHQRMLTSRWCSIFVSYTCPSVHVYLSYRWNLLCHLFNLFFKQRDTNSQLLFGMVGSLIRVRLGCLVKSANDIQCTARLGPQVP